MLSCFLWSPWTHSYYFIYFPCLHFPFGSPFVVVCLEILEFLISGVFQSDESYWTPTKSLVHARSGLGLQFLFKCGTRMAEAQHNNGKEFVFKCYNNLCNFQCWKEALGREENKALLRICRTGWQRKVFCKLNNCQSRSNNKKKNLKSSAVIAAAIWYGISLLCAWERKPVFEQEPKLTVQQRHTLNQRVSTERVGKGHKWKSRTWVCRPGAGIMNKNFQNTYLKIALLQNIEARYSHFVPHLSHCYPLSLGERCYLGAPATLYIWGASGGALWTDARTGDGVI